LYDKAVEPNALEPRRDLTLVHATSLVVGVIIGTGIFLKAASMAQAVGTPGLVLAAWVAAGLVAMLGALCFAELGAVLPHAGGEYVYLRTAYGEIPGFLFACNAFVLGGAAVAAYGAAVAIFVSDIHRFDALWVRHTLHLFSLTWTFEFGARQLIAVGVILVFAAINCLGVMLGGRVQTILTATKVAAIVLVAAGVFLFSDGGAWSNLGGRSAGVVGSGGFAGFGGAMFAALWAYSGWQFLPMAAGEVREPQRTLPRAIVGGTVLVLALYLAVNTAYLYALPFWQVASANSTAYPDAPSVAARAVATFLGTRAAPIAALIFLISTIGSLNGVILSAARVPYAAPRRPVLRALRAVAPQKPRAGDLPGAARAVGCAARRLRHLRPAHQHGGDVVRALLDPGVARRAGAAQEAAARAALLPRARLPAGAAGVRARHGVDRRERTPHRHRRIGGDAGAGGARPAALSAVPPPRARCAYCDSSSHRVSGAPRRSHRPRPASRKCRPRRVRYQRALRRCTSGSVRARSQLRAKSARVSALK
jgi:amino acid transporter